MKASLIVYNKELRNLKSFVKGIEKSASLLTSKFQRPMPLEEHDFRLYEFREHYQSFHLEQSKFNYKTIIISLYGLLESFVENLLKSFLERLNNIIESYQDLPPEILNNHYTMSASLIQKIDRMTKYEHIRKEEVIRNLNSCVENRSGYVLNIEAYTYHSANFKHDGIKIFMKQVGIEVGNKIPEERVFQQYLENNYGAIPHESLSVYEKLNDLANRRNDVAHGSEIDLLGVDDLLEYIDFIEVYCNSLYEVVFKELLLYEVLHNSEKLNKPIDIINNNIICLELNNLKIAVGDIIVSSSKNKSMPFLYSEIKSIQIDGLPYEEVTECESVFVGISVDFKPKHNHTFYIIKS